MQEYGYINEDGFLRTVELREEKENYRDGDEIKTRIVSIEEQAERYAAQGYKPVDLLDNEQMKAPEGYVIRIVPYDAGDRISFHYVTERDLTKIRKEISELKESLANSDYKVLKCYEASLIGETMPYDTANLHAERQTIRDKINELEASL